MQKVRADFQTSLISRDHATLSFAKLKIQCTASSALLNPEYIISSNLKAKNDLQFY